MRLQVKVMKGVITAAFFGLALMIGLPIAAQDEPEVTEVTATYDFEPDTGTFTSIRDTGMRADGRTFVPGDISTKDGNLERITIPFEFYFFGRRISTLVPTTNFFLSANPRYSCTSSMLSGSCRSIEESKLSTTDRFGFGNLDHQGGIYPFWTDTIYNTAAGARVLYELSGNPGNQVMTIEFSQLPLSRDSATLNSLSAQVKLYENDGSIEFIYQQGNDAPTSTYPAFVGIAATAEFNTESTTTRYYSVQSLDTPALTENEDSNFQVFPMNRSNNVRPQTGQVFRFTPDFYLPHPPNLSVAVDTNFSYTLPEAIYPTGAVTYALTGGLPTGFSFVDDNDTPRRISGMSSDTVNPTTLTYTATDDLGDADIATSAMVSQTFTFAVTANTSPDLSSGSIFAIFIVQNTESLTLIPYPIATGGNAPLTYSLSPDLPAGLFFNAESRLIYGISSESIPTTPYVYTVTDSDGQTDTLNFNITVTSQVTAPIPSQDFVFVAGEEVNETLNAFNGGRGTLTYALMPSPDLPPGLVFTAGSRLISETPTDDETDNMFRQETYTYTATDNVGVSATKTFTIEVVDAMPVAPVPLVRDEVFIVGEEITVILPEFTTTVDANTKVTAPQLMHTLTDGTDPIDDDTNALIAGLEWDPGNRRISGTPNAVVAATEYTYTATEGGDSESVSVTFTITTRDTTLTRPTVSPLVFTPGQMDASNTLPAFTGGTGMKTHSLSHGTNTNTGLPGGLSFDPTNLTITIPATSGSDSLDATLFTYAATDEGDETASVNFTIAIEDDEPAFASNANISDFTGIVGVEITPVPLPVVETAGTGETTYMFFIGGTETELPDGLRVINDNQIVGEPTTELVTTTYMYTARDTDGDTDSIEFTITVEADTVPVAPDPLPSFTFTVRQNLDTIPGVNNFEGINNRLAFSGGNPPLMYAFADNTTFPDGLTLTLHETRAALIGDFNGTDMDDSTMDGQPLVVTYTATDRNGNPVNSTVTLTLLDPLPMVPDEFEQVHEFVPGDDVAVTLPDFEGGNTPLMYILTDASGTVFDGSTDLTAGLEYTPADSMIAGMIDPDTEDVDDSVGIVTYTYTATDVDMDAAPAEFTIEVIDPRPLLPEVIQSNYAFISDDPVPSDTLPDFRYINITGGVDPALTYTLSNESNLPMGLEFNATTGKISGTPTEETVGTPPSFTITARDGTDSASYPFTIEITDDPVPEPPTITDGGYTFRVGEILPLTSTGTGREPLVLPVFTVQYDDDSSTLTHRLANAAGVTIDNGTVSLIGGLMYNQATRTIHGEVMGTANFDDGDTATYTYEATETDAPSGQDNDTNDPPFTFTITIVDEMPSFTGLTIEPDPIPAIEDFLFTTAPLPEVVKNTEVPPEPIGTGMITYSVTDADGNPTPSWLDFNMDSRVLSGTPDAVLTGDDSMFRYTATDEDLDTASIDFTIDVEAADEPEVPVSYEEVLYLEPGDVLLGATIVDLPVFTGGNGMLTYDLLDDDDNPVDRFLSGRLTFTRSTREIMGTLADDKDGDDSDSATYTYIATDVDGSTAMTPFTIEVIDARPLAPDDPIENVVVRPGMNVETGKTLPPFGFGDSIPQDSGISEPVLTYSLTDNKPSWLSIDETSRVLSGMAPDEVSSVEVTYMATDGADTDTTTFTLIVTPDIPQPPEILPFNFSVGMVVDETLPPFTGGDGILDYSIVQGNNLVGGLTFDPAADARTISGTVTISGGNIPPPATYMYMAVDAEGDPNMVSFTITIEANVMPVAPTPPQMLTFAPGEQNASMTLESFTGGNGMLTYSATTAVVEEVLADFGLTFVPETLTISGNISIADDSDPNNKAITYTYTATDRDGSTADANFTIAVVDNAPMIPTGPQDFFVPVGSPVTVTLAPFTGSDEPFTYAIDTTTRDLPEGLNLGPAPGPGNLVISGNIMDGAGDDGDSESVTYTYTATDSVGDSTSATFTIWVVDVRPEAPTQEEIGEFRISSGESFTAINGTLPEFGNNIPEGSNIAEPMFDYTLDESLTWLTFTPSTRRLEGEAPATASSTEVTYSVTYGPDTDSVTFNIVVTNDPAPEVTEDLMELVFLPGDTVNAENGMLPEFMISDDSILMYNIYLPTDTDLENPITNLVIDTTTLSFDSTPANRVLSGEIMATSGDDTATANFIYAATDSDPVAPPAEGDGPDTTPDPFTITIVDDIPDFTGDSINNITVTANAAFTPVTLPDTEGTRTVTYTLARSDGMPFPDWLTFQNDPNMADPLLLSGTAPSVVPDPASIAFTYSAIDEDLDTTTPLTFTITVEANEQPVAPTTQELIFVPGQQNVSRTLEPFTGGNEPFTYSATTLTVQEVMADFGLTFNPATRTIMGDINVADDSDPNNKDAITYTYTATDRDGEPTNANFTIEVVDNIPMAPTGPQDFFVPVGSPVTVTLAPFTGSDRAPPPNDAFTYTIDTNILSLPTGLSLGEGANNLVISGTIVDTAGDDGNSEPLTYTYIATGSGGDSESATFTIQVIDARPVAVDVDDVEFTVDVRRAIVFPEFDNNIPNDLPQDANIPVPTFNYDIIQIDELPEDGTTSFIGRTLSVLVTRFFEYDFLFTYSALEVDGEDSATANFMITIVVDPAPKVTEDLMELVFLPGDTVDAENGMLPEFMISDGSELMYNIYLESDTDLENPITDLVIDTTTTLRFDPDTTNPVLTGTIPATSGDDAATANFIYAATDSDPAEVLNDPSVGDGPETTSDPFTITIVDERPDFTGDSIGDITVTANSAFTPVTLPDTEGTRTVTYTLERSDGNPFPSWLTFQNDLDMADPLLLSGTAPPVVPTPATIPFTYSAMDEDGDTTPIPLTFTITVEADEVPVAPDPKPSFPFTVGEDISSVTGVDPATALAFTPGDGATTYTVPTPTLPEGLSFNTSTAALTGTPEGTPRPDGFVDRVYTYTATDEDGDAVESTFTITLIDPLPIAPTPPDFTFTVREPISSISGGVEPLAFVDGSGNGDLMYALAADTDTTEFSERGLTLTLDADTAALSGTFNGTAMNDATDPLVVTYTATDEDGDAVNSTFTLTLIDPLPTLPAIDNLVYEVGQTILTPSVTLPMSPGGNAPLSYRLRNAAGQMDNGAVPFALIEGFVYAPSPSTRVISGTVGIDTAADQNVPATNVAAPEYTFIVTDADGDIATETFTIRVVDSIPVAPVVRNRSFSISRQITPVVLTAFATTTDPTPNPDLTHSLIHDDGVVIDDTTNELLPGLMWNPDTRTISGTPTELTVDSDNNNDPIDITYRATDGFDSATETFTISVVSDSVPDISAIEEGYIFNVGVDPMLALPESEGGDGVIVYSLFLSSDTGMTPLTTLADPPSPLSAFTFDPDPVSGPPTISGTFAGTDEDDSVSAVMYTYTATDVDTEFDSEPFTITINDEMPEFANGAMITNITGVVNTAITTVTLPPVETAGSVSTTYSLLNAEGNAVTELIDGLTFNPDDRVLAGTPRASLAGTYTYTATDADGDTATIPFTITITNEMPNFGPRTINNISVTVGMDFTTVTLPAVVTDGTGTTTYSLEALDGNGDPLPQLPYGLSFNRTSRMLSGTRTLTADDAGLTNVAVTDLRYTAMDEDGDSTPALTFTITITDEVPMFASNQQPPPPITGTVDTLLPPVTLPAVETDGTGMTTYSLSPDITVRAPGLTFASDTRVIAGTPTAPLTTNNTFSYTAMDENGDSTPALTFTITIQPVGDPVDIPIVAPTVMDFTFAAGDTVAASPATTLPVFTGGNDGLTYSLALSSESEPRTSVTDLVGGLEFDPSNRQITGTVRETNGNDSVMATEYTYSATDGDGDTATATFTITITDDYLMPPADPQEFSFEPGEMVSVTLDPHTGGPGDPITYALITTTTPALPGDLALNRTSRVISGTLPDSTMAETTYTYRATSGNEMHDHTFTIAITDAPSLEMATASAIPTVGANIALVASQAISSRVELALNGLSSGIDIRTLDGPQLRLNPQQQNGGSGSPVRFGVWYSAASDSLSDSRGDVAWDGTTDSTNLGFDVGFDISASASLVVGILQNSSSTSATYRNSSGSGGDGTLSVDLDSTAFYVGLGYDWLDAWFANGSADSTLNDSVTMMAIPASFSYQTIGLTASFEVAESFSIGGKVESLTSDLSLAAMADDEYMGLSTDSSQLRTAFVANYQLKLGENGNGLLIPKFEFGFRDLSLGSSIQENFTAAGGSAMETGFGIDYLQRAWGLTVGLDIRSISVENYSSDSTQYQIRWESGNYGNGLSFQLTPHSVSETLGGIDSLYSGGYNQYQSVLERQRGGNSTQDSKGLDFEVGYGFVASYGTVTPYLKTTNYRGSGNRAQEFGIRYQTLSGLELTLRAERELTPQTIQILGFPLTFMQDENALTFNTRYSF